MPAGGCRCDHGLRRDVAARGDGDEATWAKLIAIGENADSVLEEILAVGRSSTIDACLELTSSVTELLRAERGSVDREPAIGAIQKGLRGDPCARSSRLATAPQDPGCDCRNRQ